MLGNKGLREDNNKIKALKEWIIKMLKIANKVNKAQKKLKVLMEKTFMLP